MALQYKTKSNQNPNGKPRVFFCCHDDDFSCFEEICADIFACADCAVFYYDGSVSADDRQMDLSQMQLFVMPVTAKLLSTQNCGLDDFRFAQKNHIPVLPLMQEQGLDALFNEKCGDLQYLNKYADDATAIGFEVKLKKYLDTVLIGDQMAQKIREAFDAYIFLSYRKKDRRYAQELMKLIHERDFCRDIAIWYDEFLTPGENFNDNIKQALDKSRLFALVVTPNLVNENNYVMTVEYPMAQKAGKRVVPAQLVQTDKQQLKQMYSGIDDPVDVQDAERLNAVLSEAVTGIDLRQKNDPLHNYFIGLAYHAGIDVEVNHERALELIQSAANAGLDEATYKLINMYSDGDGVPRDYDKVVEWQASLLNKYYRKYLRWRSKKNAVNYTTVLLELADLLYNKSSYPLSLSAYRVAIRECKRFCIFHRDVYFKRALYSAYFRAGRILAYQSNLKEAYQMYLDADAVSRKMHCSNDEFVCMKLEVNHGVMEFWHLVGDDEEYAAACKELIKICDLCEELVGTTEEIMRNRISAYQGFGLHLVANGQADDGMEYLQRATGILDELLGDDDSFSAMQQRAYQYTCLSRAAQKQKDYASAKLNDEKALELFQDVYEKTGLPRFKRSIAVLYSRLGLWEEMTNNLSAAQSHYEKSLELCREVKRETDTFESGQDLCHAYGRLANMFNDAGDYDKAISACEKQKQCFDELWSQLQTGQLLYEGLELGWMLHILYGDDVEKMYDILAWSVNMLLDFPYKSFPKDNMSAREYASFLTYNLLVVCLQQDKIDEMEHYAYKWGDWLAEETDRGEFHLKDRADCASFIAIVNDEKGDIEEKIRWYQIAAAKAQEYAEAFPSRKATKLVMEANLALGTAYFELDFYPEAEEALGEVFAAVNSLEDELNFSEGKIFAEACVYLALIYQKTGEVSRAKEQASLCLDAVEALLGENSDDEICDIKAKATALLRELKD